MHWCSGLFGVVVGIGILLAVLDNSFWPVATAIVLVVEFFLWLRIQSHPCRDCELLKKRMEGYALLKSPPKYVGISIKVSPEHTQFEVILGIAKKVELKAAALLTILAILVAATGIFAKDTKILLSVVLILSIPMLALIRVFHQIDSFDIRDAGVQREIFARHLKSDIMSDLIVKERCFRFAYEVTFGLLAVSLVSIIAILLLDATGRRPIADSIPSCYVSPEQNLDSGHIESQCQKMTIAVSAMVGISTATPTPHADLTTRVLPDIR